MKPTPFTIGCVLVLLALCSVALYCIVDFIVWIWRGLMIVGDGLTEVVIRRGGKGGHF